MAVSFLSVPCSLTVWNILFILFSHSWSWSACVHSFANFIIHSALSISANFFHSQNSFRLLLTSCLIFSVGFQVFVDVHPIFSVFLRSTSVGGAYFFLQHSTCLWTGTVYPLEVSSGKRIYPNFIFLKYFIFYSLHQIYHF